VKALDAINRDRARRAHVEETAAAEKRKASGKTWCARCGCLGGTCEISVLVCDVVIMYGKCVAAGTLGFTVCSACHKKGPSAAEVKRLPARAVVR
jgi:hypothetical protein